MEQHKFLNCATFQTFEPCLGILNEVQYDHRLDLLVDGHDDIGEDQRLFVLDGLLYMMGEPMAGDLYNNSRKERDIFVRTQNSDLHLTYLAPVGLGLEYLVGGGYLEVGDLDAPVQEDPGIARPGVVVCQKALVVASAVFHVHGLLGALRELPVVGAAADKVLAVS